MKGMRGKTVVFVILILLLSVVVSGCAAGEAMPTATAPGAAPPNADETEEAAGSPTPEPTEAPAATPSPMQTETPAATASEPPLEPPESLSMVGERLAGQMQVAPEAVEVGEVESVEWPDACLGAALPGEMCAQVITPGFRVIFDSPQGPVEVHTNATGDFYRLVPPSGPGGLETPAVFWERSGGFAGVCQRMTIGENGVYTYQDCSREENVPSIGVLPQAQVEQVQELLQQYGTVEWQVKPPPGSADIFLDKFALSGEGSATPTAAEQQAINDLLASIAAPLEGQLPDTGGPPAADESGIVGQVLVSPACAGPEHAGEECPAQPFLGSMLVFDAAGRLAETITTDDEGRFSATLPPGRYILRPEAAGRYPQAKDTEVVVEAGEYAEVAIELDSGIR